MKHVNRRHLALYLSLGVITALSPGAGYAGGGEPSSPSAVAQPVPGAAGQQASAEERALQRQRYLPHCGLYCLYMAMKLAGRDINYRKLVKPEYYGSLQGSSLVELQRAAEDYGLYAAPASHLTIRDLCRSHYPMILHVKASLASVAYDHYVLFLGATAQQARIIDPPARIEWIPFRDLAPRWKGNGLLISARPIEAGFIYGPRYGQMAVYGALGAAIIGTGYFTKRRFARWWMVPPYQRLGLTMAQSIAVGALVVVFSLLQHLGNEAGFLAYPRAVRALQKTHAANFIPKISTGKAARLLGDGTLFIDARLTPDYQAGHLAGAINVPVDANDLVRHEKVKTIPRNAPIVVYCQSAACKFAEKVALKLVDDGFSRVSVFRGGWMEWASKHKDDIGHGTPEESKATEDHA
jgi:rhodanese-related sulfurtransferase